MAETAAAVMAAAAMEAAEEAVTARAVEARLEAGLGVLEARSAVVRYVAARLPAEVAKVAAPGVVGTAYRYRS